MPFRLFGFYWFLTLLFSSDSFPPRWYERHAQRKKVLERVQAAGGWEALRRDCIALIATNESIRWVRGAKNDAPLLPPVIKALQPKEVDYISPPKLDSYLPRVPIVRIKIFGAYATGGHSTPYFGLQIVASPSIEDYAPTKHPGASGNSHGDYRKVSEGVFEIF